MCCNLAPGQRVPRAQCQPRQPAAAWGSASLFMLGGWWGISPLVGSPACPAYSGVQAARVPIGTRPRTLWFLHPSSPVSGAPLFQEHVPELSLLTLAETRPPTVTVVFTYSQRTSHRAARQGRLQAFLRHLPPPGCQARALADQHPNQSSFLKDERHLQHPVGSPHQHLGLSCLISHIPSPNICVLKLMPTKFHV